MKGEVEIWKGDQLVHKGSNMLVDGAGVLLADAMTVSPSLSGIEDHATSSILDASNYRIQAISFGTGEDAFRANAHALTTNKIDYFISQGVVDGTLSIDKFGLPSIVEELVRPGKGFYIPEVGLPIAPEPMLTTLESNTSVSAVVGDHAVSSVFPGNGQLTNFLPSAIMSSMMEDTVFSSTLSAIMAATVLGCFPDGSSAPYTSTAAQNIRRVIDPVGNTISINNNTNQSHFNEVSSMDVSGFVNMVMSSVPHTTNNYLMSSTASGLCISSSPEDLNQGFKDIEYSVALSQGDVGHANLYGGIHHIGLWSIDMKSSLLNGNTPPFAFSVLNNPRKYRLFCRKGFSKNITSILDSGANSGDQNYTPLIIKWRIRFRDELL